VVATDLEVFRHSLYAGSAVDNTLCSEEAAWNVAGSASWCPRALQLEAATSYDWHGAGALSWSYLDNSATPHNQAANHRLATRAGAQAAIADSGVGDCKSAKAKAKIHQSVELDDSLVFVIGPEDFVQNPYQSASQLKCEAVIPDASSLDASTSVKAEATAAEVTPPAAQAQAELGDPGGLDKLPVPARSKGGKEAGEVLVRHHALPLVQLQDIATLHAVCRLHRASFRSALAHKLHCKLKLGSSHGYSNSPQDTQTITLIRQLSLPLGEPGGEQRSKGTEVGKEKAESTSAKVSKDADCESHTEPSVFPAHASGLASKV